MGRRRSSAASMAASMMERPLLDQLLGELHDQNRVLRRKADQHHQSDLHVDVVDQTTPRDERQRTQHRHRYGQQDDEGQREALVLCREREIDHDRCRGRR